MRSSFDEVNFKGVDDPLSVARLPRFCLHLFPSIHVFLFFPAFISHADDVFVFSLRFSCGSGSFRLRGRPTETDLIDVLRWNEFQV